MSDRQVFSYIFILILVTLISSCAFLKSDGNIKHKSGQLKSADLDIENFIGERFLLEHPASGISDLKVNIIFPENYEMIEGSNPYMRISGKKGIIEQIPFSGTIVSKPLNRYFNEDEIYIELALFYCRDDEQGICLLKNILYTVRLSDVHKQSSLNINYTVPKEVY